MRTKFLLNLGILFIFGQVSFAQEAQATVKEPVIYPFGEPGSSSRGVFGEDDRKEVTDAEGYEDFARATAVMIPKEYLSGNSIYAPSLRDLLSYRFGSESFAEDVKFLDQPAAGSCTGFLIAPDILVTAGHCILTIEDAKDYVWVFDYTNNVKYDGQFLQVEEEDIFEVAEVLSAELDDYSDSDYSVLRLTRKSDRRPYRFRTSGTIALGENVYTVGSPTGIPLKLAENAIVVENTPDYWFKSDIDVFPGNSGGPVFDKAGWIEGILVRGAVELSSGDYSGDFIHDPVCNCIRTVNFEEVAGTAGSQTHKITRIPYELMFASIYENLEYGIRNFSNRRIEDWDDYSWIFSHEYTLNRKPLEEVALEVGNVKALESILSHTSSRFDDAGSRGLLEKAMSAADLELLQVLLEKGIYADAGITYSRSLLQESVADANQKAAALLIEHGANFRVTDGQKNNLLHYAAGHGNMEMIKLLVSLGIDPGAKNSDKKLPEKIARSKGHKTAFKYLKAARKGKI